MSTSQKDGKPWIQFHLKTVLVLHPAHAEGFGQTKQNKTEKMKKMGPFQLLPVQVRIEPRNNGNEGVLYTSLIFNAKASRSDAV